MKAGLRHDEQSWILSMDPRTMTLPTGRFEQVAARCAAKGLVIKANDKYHLTHRGFNLWERLCDWRNREPVWLVLLNCRLVARERDSHAIGNGAPHF